MEMTNQKLFDLLVKNFSSNGMSKDVNRETLSAHPAMAKLYEAGDTLRTIISEAAETIPAGQIYSHSMPDSYRIRQFIASNILNTDDTIWSARATLSKRAAKHYADQTAALQALVGKWLNLEATSIHYGWDRGNTRKWGQIVSVDLCNPIGNYKVVPVTFNVKVKGANKDMSIGSQCQSMVLTFEAAIALLDVAVAKPVVIKPKQPTKKELLEEIARLKAGAAA